MFSMEYIQCTRNSQVAKSFLKFQLTEILYNKIYHMFLKKGKKNLENYFIYVGFLNYLFLLLHKNF